jgi:hypothetical protein
MAMIGTISPIWATAKEANAISIEVPAAPQRLVRRHRRASISYWTPSPNAPPRGTHLVITHAARLSCFERQDATPGGLP